MSTLGPVLAHLESKFETYLEQLIEFASIPSISTDPAFTADVARASRWVADRLERAGVPVVEILETPGHPVVYASAIQRRAETRVKTRIVLHHHNRFCDRIDRRPTSLERGAKHHAQHARHPG